MSVHIRLFDNNCTTPHGMLSFRFLSYDDVAFSENPNFETKSRRLSL